MKPALLDTNVLLALSWPNHQHHALAHRWFEREAQRAWATCALTELAFVRLSSNPAYTAEAVTPQEAAGLLRQLCSHAAHRFWNSPPARDPDIYKHAMGHQQVMDAWLVEATRHNKGRLATFDRRLAVHDADAELVVVIA